jgi:dual specificity protein kinase YAK1
MFGSFSYKDHLCIVLELLGSDLLSLLEQLELKGFPIHLVQCVARDLFQSLVLFRHAEIVHCDLKPENIVVVDGPTAHVKVIDFGSSRPIGELWLSYIQSRYYRAPEVVLRIPYGYAIDIWSVGCILCELFLGIPLFGGQTEFQLLEYHVRFLGQLPRQMVQASPRRKELFLPNGRLKTEAQWMDEQGVVLEPMFDYHTKDTIEEIILGYEWKLGDTERERALQQERRTLFVDLIRRLLVFAPEERISPEDALNHPFVTADFFANQQTEDEAEEEEKNG